MNKKKTKETKFDKFISKLKDNKWIVYILIFGFIIINIAAFTESVTKISVFIDKIFPNKEGIEPFKENTFGILVAAFKGNTEEQINKGKDIQHTIAGTLNARFKELRILNADAREISVDQHPTLKRHKKAREIGRNYNATIVIWGDITLAGVIPNITIVNPRSPITTVSQPDITLLKDTLLHTAIDDIDDIRFPALTDEPTLLVSFLTGVKYYYKSNYDKALYYFKKSLPENNTKCIDSAPILVFIGDTCSKKQEYDNAISAYTEAIEINPNYALAYVNRGNSYVEKGEFKKALSDYDIAIEINPKYSGTHNNRGVVYAKKEEYEKALSDYTTAIEINPKYADAYNNRGNTYKKKEDFDKALSDYERAIEINPKHELAYNNRGIIYSIKGEFKKALVEYDEALEINPEFGLAYYNRARCYIENGEPEKALIDCNKAIEINPKNADAYFNKGQISYEKGRKEEALDAYKNFINYASSKDERLVSIAKQRIKELEK